MSDQRCIPIKQYKSKYQGLVKLLVLFLLVLFISLPHSCREIPVALKEEDSPITSGSARLGLWLAKKGGLIEHESAA